MCTKQSFFWVERKKTNKGVYVFGLDKTKQMPLCIWLRCIFLETVAGVPGFAAGQFKTCLIIIGELCCRDLNLNLSLMADYNWSGMIRHLHSLRRMERDHGWIHTLLEVSHFNNTITDGGSTAPQNC